MADIWLGRFARWLEKFFNAKGGGSLFDLNPSVQVTLPIFSGNEDRFLQGWNRYIVSNFVAALAANFGEFRLRNPAGSNVVAVVERITTFGLLDQPAITVGSTGVDLPTLLSAGRLDSRSAISPTCIPSSGTSGAGPVFGPFFYVSQPANVNAEFVLLESQEYPIPPGFTIDLKSNTANQNITFSIMWRERALESSELA